MKISFGQSPPKTLDKILLVRAQKADKVSCSRVSIESMAPNHYEGLSAGLVVTSEINPLAVR